MRELDWGGVPNIRDLGGLPGRFGSTRYGRVARGPRRERLSDAGWDAARRWGLSTVIDLRSADEAGRRDSDPVLAAAPEVVIVSAPTEDQTDPEFRQVCLPILDSPEYWAHNLRILPDLIHRTLEAIADATPGVLIHCSAGRDRTGMISALLLANAGVAPETIADDYELSVRAMAGTAAHHPTPDRQGAWDASQVNMWLAEVKPIVIDFARHTSDHLDGIGLTPSRRHQLQALLVND